MSFVLKFLIKLSSLNRTIALFSLKILKLLKKNRGYFKIENNLMFLDFLDPIDRKIIISKKYEEKEFSILNKLIRNFNANFFFDIGANNGYYSIKLAELYKDIKIIAFEPNNEAYFKFKKTLDISHKISKRIVLNNFGLSDKNSTKKMRSKVKYGYAQTGGSTVHDGKEFNDIQIYEANFKVGDQILNIKNCNLVFKIDVEGHEINVLRGLKNTIDCNNCILQIEIFKENFETINKFLIENKFEKINVEINNSNHFYSKNL
tara:strand:- start:136 stop:918 length:783 start_codon:yes stop_codon:yes gene_type:complete